MSPNPSPAERTLRIIGGNWRSRKISFPDIDAIRPTPDRVRETLFNWLQFDIAGARCLELYAGSGVLGIEALSRGAAKVTAIERDRLAAHHLQRNFEELGAAPDAFEVVETSAHDYLARSEDRWDIAFLDPPFDSGEFTRILPLMDARLEANALMYLESRNPIDPAILPPRFNIHRRKRAGQVHYLLCVSEADPQAT
ncbi:MAG: 16S rRNA (guanine(966)-N(2))-methyltransferase RsmD [Gammaproteobacteria bacterium]|nr:16S rRNA (guanine(966)-N(2))-methyltransferase RsmD [Gammaproteobacteria bacterium]